MTIVWCLCKAMAPESSIGRVIRRHPRRVRNNCEVRVAFGHRRCRRDSAPVSGGYARPSPSSRSLQEVYDTRPTSSLACQIVWKRRCYAANLTGSMRGLSSTSIAKGIVLTAPMRSSARPAAFLWSLLSFPEKRRPMPMPNATRVPAIRASSGVVIRLSFMRAETARMLPSEFQSGSDCIRNHVSCRVSVKG